MPTAMHAPTTTAMAEASPSSRRKPGLGAAAVIVWIVMLVRRLDTRVKYYTRVPGEALVFLQYCQSRSLSLSYGLLQQPEQHQGGAPEITGFSANRPNLVSGQKLNSGPRSVSAWLNASAFTRITQDLNSPVQQFGDEGRNAAPGTSLCELGLLRFQRYSHNGIERTAVLGGVLQYPEPHELPSTEQRYRLAHCSQ